MSKLKSFVIKKNLNLDEWLPLLEKGTHSSQHFPARDGSSYSDSYAHIASYLDANIHRQIEQAALVKELSKGTLYDEAIYLTDHGPGHIACVIARASDILHQLRLPLTPYECFILLLAIQFHDVGNLHGRKEHELRVITLTSELVKNHLLYDATEARLVSDIASAHGGKTESGSKDTISLQLRPEEEFLGHTVRPRFLAALLRFSDELADDRARASRFMLDTGMIPAASEIFHAYCNSLKSVKVKGNTIRLKYELTPETGTKEYEKLVVGPGGTRAKKTVFLFDEIPIRSRKMHQERMYCMRFWPTEYQTIDIIDVEILVHLLPFRGEYPLRTYPVNFQLRESGYPGDTSNNDGCVLCINGENEDIHSLDTGLDIKARIEKSLGDLPENTNE